MALDVFWHCYIMDLMKKLRVYDVPRKSRSNLYLTCYLSERESFFVFRLNLVVFEGFNIIREEGVPSRQP